MTRPDAPMIPATAELLEGWCGPVVHDGDTCAHLLGYSLHPDGADGMDLRHILLDLRRSEVQDRVARVWWGAPGPALRLSKDGPVLCVMRENGPVIVARSSGRGLTTELYVPALADMPDPAWALWEGWRAMEDR